MVQEHYKLYCKILSKAIKVAKNYIMISNFKL